MRCMYNGFLEGFPHHGVVNFCCIPSHWSNIARANNRSFWWLERDAKDSVVRALGGSKINIVNDP